MIVTRWAGHGVRYVHQDRAEVQAPLHQRAGGRGDAVHRGNPEHDHADHMRPAAAAVPHLLRGRGAHDLCTDRRSHPRKTHRTVHATPQPVI